VRAPAGSSAPPPSRAAATAWLVASELAQVALSGADLAAVRADYEPPWNQANALRTGLSIAAFSFLVAALARDRRPDREARTGPGGAALF
jgi:hypothetical protein